MIWQKEKWRKKRSVKTGREQVRKNKRKTSVKPGKKQAVYDLPQKCPYCGGKMLIHYPGQKNGKTEKGDHAKQQIKPVMVCENNTCTCYLNLKTDWTGKLLPVGIPADENLRILRTEAHHYLNYFMQAAGMDYKAAYQTISDITGLPVSMCHISMMDEVQCRRLTAEILKYIVRMGQINPQKLRKTGNLTAFYSYKGYTFSNAEAQNMVKEINEIANG
jgi:rRNA maturation protein Nop10